VAKDFVRRIQASVTAKRKARRAKEKARRRLRDAMLAWEEIPACKSLPFTSRCRAARALPPFGTARLGFQFFGGAYSMPLKQGHGADAGRAAKMQSLDILIVRPHRHERRDLNPNCERGCGLFLVSEFLVDSA
jgi:hypothetical protein